MAQTKKSKALIRKPAAGRKAGPCGCRGDGATAVDPTASVAPGPYGDTVNIGRPAALPMHPEKAGPGPGEMLAALALAATVFYLTFHVIKALARGWPLVLK